jgi:regulatory protein YycH of two-component signal transduction system YycFG
MEDLKSQINELEAKATELQQASATREFNLTVTDNAEFKQILKFIDKSYTWQSKNAALAVHVYDSMKEAVKSAEPTEGGIEVSLSATIMTGLYNILLNIEGQGVESARSFVRVLTNVGEQVTNALNVLSEDNKEIQELHSQIHELEQQLQAEENETSEQIQEEA